MSFNEPKPILNAAIDKIIQNLRSTEQPSIGCSPFSKQFNSFLISNRNRNMNYFIELTKCDAPPPQNKYVFIPLQKEGKCYWNNSYNVLSIEN